jgi:hypothetical protein
MRRLEQKYNQTQREIEQKNFTNQIRREYREYESRRGIEKAQRELQDR